MKQSESFWHCNLEGHAIGIHQKGKYPACSLEIGPSLLCYRLLICATGQEASKITALSRDRLCFRLSHYISLLFVLCHCSDKVSYCNTLS